MIDVASKKISDVATAEGFEFNEYVWSPDSRWIAYTKPEVEGMNKVYLYSLEGGKTIDVTDGWYTSGSPAFSEDGRFLAARDSQDTHVFDVSDDDSMSVLRGHESYVYPVIFDRDGARIWSGSWDGTARAWDAETHEPIVTLQAGTNVLTLSVSPDGRRIIGVLRAGLAHGRIWPGDVCVRSRIGLSPRCPA